MLKLSSEHPIKSRKLGKLKDLWNGEHKGFVRYAVIATAVFVVWVVFFGSDNLVRWLQARRELHRQNRQIEWYKKEIATMDEQIRTLSTDRDTLETYARGNFRFAAPGDDVYIENEKQ